MAARKDMRRVDLVIPYSEPIEEKSTDFNSTITSTMPMAAMFTRNKMIGWASLVVSLLNWLGETDAQKSTQSTPGYLSFGMALMAVGVTYMPLFLPPTQNVNRPAASASPTP